MHNLREVADHARIEDHLGRSNVTTVADGLSATWQPDADESEACRRLGRAVAEAILSS